MKRVALLLALAAFWSCGKTVFKNERFACERTGDCADGFVCSAGECRSFEVDAGMSRADGGSGSGCGAVVTGCNPGFTCVSGTCGRCWAAVKTGFELANDPAWVLDAADITGGSLIIAVTSRNSMSADTTATSAETLPLVGCGVTIELATAPSVVAGYQARMGLRSAASSQQPSFEWQVDTRGVVATWAFADGGVGEQVVVPAGTAPPRWLRIEESDGEVRWRATNASTFTTLHTLSHGESLTGMKLEFSARFPPQGGNQRVSFSIDSINEGP